MIKGLRKAILEEGRYEFSIHATDRVILRKITLKELKEAFEMGEIIEDYPDDKYGPSCLVFGRTKSGRPLHIQCSYPTRQLVKIITIYEPDPSEWVDFIKRR